MTSGRTRPSRILGLIRSATFDVCRCITIGRVNAEIADHGREFPGEAALWHRLHAAIDRLTPETASVPGYFEEGWTAKDAVAHIGTWMAQGAQMLRRVAAGSYVEDEIDVDAENARFLEAMRDIPLETVHLQATAARGELRRAWAELPEVTPAADYWARKSGPEHVEEHLPRLESWLEELDRRSR
jgi:hypothetical protein